MEAEGIASIFGEAKKKKGINSFFAPYLYLKGDILILSQIFTKFATIYRKKYARK